MTQKAGSSFESIIEELEQIVEQLEQGEPPLEDALRLFAQGVRLCQQGAGQLAAAERTIAQLLRDPETGEVTWAPWLEEDGSTHE